MKDANLVKAFKEAKILIQSDDESFICSALTIAHCDSEISHTTLRNAHNVIRERIGSIYWSLEHWVVRNVPNITNAYLYSNKGAVQMKIYRLRWLDALIKEFS